MSNARRNVAGSTDCRQLQRLSCCVLAPGGQQVVAESHAIRRQSREPIDRILRDQQRENE
jgi:hypothetical protein